MTQTLRGRRYLDFDDYSPDEVAYLVDLAAELKAAKRAGTEKKALVGAEIVVIAADEPTAMSALFTIAAHDQGAHVTVVYADDMHLAGWEAIDDTARSLGGLYDVIECRGLEDGVADALAYSAAIPVWNGLTTGWHPAGTLAAIAAALGTQTSAVADATENRLHTIKAVMVATLAI